MNFTVVLVKATRNACWNSAAKLPPVLTGSFWDFVSVMLLMWTKLSRAWLNLVRSAR